VRAAVAAGHNRAVIHHHRRPFPILLAFAALAFVPARAAAPAERPSIDSVLDTLGRVVNLRETAIAPDGSRVAWAQKLRGADGTETRSSLHLSAVDGSGARVLTAARDGKPHRERDVAWSPDGREIAFLSDAAQEGQLQIYIAPAAGGTARVLTRAHGQLEHPRWSPDGKRIAVLYVAGSAQEQGALVAYKPDAGVVEEKVEEQRIAIVDAAGGELREVSPADLYVYDYDWSPDGKRFAAEAVHGSGTNNYWTAELYVVDAASGEARSLWKPPLQIAQPRWSPDGASIAVIHGLMSDEGSTGGDVMLVPAAGGPARNLTPGFPGSASWIAFRPSGDVLFTAHADGETMVGTVSPSAAGVTTAWRGPALLTYFSLSRDGRVFSAVYESFTEAPEVWAGALAGGRAVTRLNAGVKAPWGEVKSLHWDSDGQRVQGWLIAPPHVDPGVRHPLVVNVHGGPSSASSPRWPSRWTGVFPTQGYYVLLPNPRGSYGQGAAFTQGNVKDFGYGDLRDILKGVDAAVAAAPIDPARVGMVGWSYGGFMSMWAVTQTDRFKAAVAGAGIVNWQSYYGQNRIDQWMLPFFGASVYDDPAVYAKSSPITFIKNVKTPTLVLHGDRDSEVPTPQGYEFWHALKTLGVPTQLVVYEKEGHAVSQPAHLKDIQVRSVEWFDRYLK
jgi:dipeptidyl aminopeptidase/acylaminoacyl peptidase